MKSKKFNRAIALLLSLMTVISIISIPLSASARYTDEDIENKISYDSLNCREDDCDCLEPENNKFAVVSPSSLNNTYDDYILVDTYQNVQKYFNEQGWTDGLPIVPPTWIKAEKFMRYTSYSDNDVVATVNGRSVTAYQVAANAIMSGCSAEYLPVCIAFVEALGEEDYLDSLRSGELTPMMYVNGPIARQLGIDNEQGMTTEECNIAIARFMELALINLAGLERTNAFGNVQPLVFSEDEENCINIGWDPHHVEEGYDLNDNVITATSFSMWGNNVTPATDLPEEAMKVLAWDITEKNLGGLGGKSVEENANAKRTILITPSVAATLAKKYKTKDALETALVENARRPLWMRTYAYYYANTGSALTKSFSDVYDELKAVETEDAKKTASPAWMNGITYAEIDTVATMTKGNTDIVIQGDESRNKTQVMPGGVSVSKEIKLDTTWDQLLADMIVSIVYPTLEACQISPVDNTVSLPSGDGIPTVLQVTKQTTYRIAASSTYANGTGKIYYDASTSTLYYWDGSATQSVVLDTTTYADFITFVEALGVNSSFTLNRSNTVTAVYARLSSNASLPDKNMVDLTADTFGSVVPTIAANATSGSNGNASIDGSTITMNDTVTKFTADLGGDTIEMGDATVDGFVTVSGTTVTVDPTVEAGATAVIGTSDGNGTYRTMTLVNGGDGTYTITYNTGNTLTLTASSYYLKGTFNDWGSTDAFVKTDNDDILSIIKDIPAGTYTFKVHNAGTDTWHGNAGTFTDTANRWTMDSSTDCTFIATGGTYEFKYEISTNKLSVYYAQTDAAATPTTKTVYVGVVEHITSFVPTLHYWNNSTGLTGDATLVATGEIQQYAVGSDYWSNAAQNFKIYKTEIPVAANGMKTYNKSANSAWAIEEVNPSDGQIILVWEWNSGADYHNMLATMITEDPSEEESTEEESTEEESSEEESTAEPTTEEPSTEAPKYEAGYYLVGSFDGKDMWTLDDVTEDMMLTENAEVSGEYTVNYTLVEGDEFKVVYTDGYTITKWYPSETASYKVPATEAGEDKTIYFRPTGNSSWSNTYIYVEPNPVEETVYLINSKSWTTVNAYAWTEGGAEVAAWPGAAMTKTGEQDVNGNDVYSITFTKSYESIIFNNGSSQTADLTLEAGKYYDLGTNKWYDTLADVPENVEPTTQTVYVGVVEHITDFVPTLHYWNNSTGLAGDAELVATGETAPYSVGSSYWSNAAQNFKIYKTEIPAEANGMKTYRLSNNDRWAAEEVSDVNGKIILVFEWGGTYHNLTGTYTAPEEITPSGTYKTIYFLDSTSNSYITDDDSNMFVYSNAGDKVKMTETIDTKSGKTLWSAKIDEAATSVTFYRASYYFDEDNASETQWGTWSAGEPTTSIYSATASATGSWVADTTAVAPTGTIDDFSYGLWIDTKGDGNTVDAIKWYKDTTGYELYVPSYVDLTNVNVYSSFDSFTIDGTSYNNGDAVSLTVGSHSVTGLTGSTTTNLGTLKVYQTESTAAMLMTTKEELFTGLTDNYMDSNAWPSGSGLSTTNFNGVYKDAIETKGSYYFYDEEGNMVNSDPVLKKIKGRGNSSFEASMRLYGKYAYNFNLDSKVELIEGSTASKKWCLLANNVDHAMMRNTFIYALADDIGIKYSPETRLVDVYDNGKYLGAYVVTEKVEYGKNTLMKDMKNLDDGNEDANIEAYANEDIMDDLEGYLVQAEGSVDVNGQTYTYQYTKSDDETNWPYHQPSDYTEYNYLLEFELYNRYTNEASWFVSPRTGQAVVVKYPEFATKDEMEWIISEFEAAESAIYSDDTDAIKAAVDVDSFAKMYLLQELSINLDSCATSYYIHNDLTTGKLVSSPVWDYDWAFGAYAKDLKYIYNGSSVTTSECMSNPEQMFVKNKALKTDAGDTTKKANYNFQAKLVHNDYVWERCQYFWTNDFVPALSDYIDNDYIGDDPKADDGVTEGKILAEWLPAFKSSVEMNDARWGSLTYEGDDWGTKVTSDYNNRSFNFYIGNCYQSGTSSASYANTVYYLNDWLVKRWNYMSSSTGGALYNEELLPQYEFENVKFTASQSEDGTQLTITPSCDVTFEGEAVEASKIAWTVYVNGEAVYNSNMTETSHTIELSEASNEVYVEYKVVDTDVTENTDPQTFTVEIPEYKVGLVTFEAVQSDDGSTVTVTPSASVTYGGEVVTDDKIQYTVYLNGKEYTTKSLTTASVDVSLTEGIVNEIYVKVSPVADNTVSASSETQKFSYGVEIATVEATFNFKSSSSLRYAPKLTVNGTTTSMSKTGNAIAKNASQTQSYYWYTATVELPVDTATKVTFTNSYSMNASTTITLTGDKTYYFGVDNLNDGTTVVDLTDEEEYIRNFVKSASHMVYNVATDAGVATTSIGGTIYKMGDADEDKTVSVLDATIIQKALVNTAELSTLGEQLADFDLDGKYTVLDATQIQIYLTR